MSAPSIPKPTFFGPLAVLLAMLGAIEALAWHVDLDTVLELTAAAITAFLG